MKVYFLYVKWGPEVKWYRCGSRFTEENLYSEFVNSLFDIKKIYKTLMFLIHSCNIFTISPSFKFSI